MAAEHGQNSFRRGVMSLVILSLLKKEDMYGYQLVQQTEQLSGGRIVTQEGSLYPVLYKLLDQGLISDRKEQVGKRMMRIYYHLEPAGQPGRAVRQSPKTGNKRLPRPLPQQLNTKRPDRTINVI